MLQVFLVFLSIVTFVLMAADPRSTDLTEVKSAWNEPLKASETLMVKDALFKDKTLVKEDDAKQV